MKKLISAMAFAADRHRHQRRKDIEASPYINHPIALANLLANEAFIEDGGTSILTKAGSVYSGTQASNPIAIPGQFFWFRI